MLKPGIIWIGEPLEYYFCELCEDYLSSRKAGFFSCYNALKSGHEELIVFFLGVLGANVYTPIPGILRYLRKTSPTKYRWFWGANFVSQIFQEFDVNFTDITEYSHWVKVKVFTLAEAFTIFYLFSSIYRQSIHPDFKETAANCIIRCNDSCYADSLMTVDGDRQMEIFSKYLRGIGEGPYAVELNKQYSNAKRIHRIVNGTELEIEHD